MLDFVEQDFEEDEQDFEELDLQELLLDVPYNWFMAIFQKYSS